MKITMFSNFMNHHQLPVCQRFDKLTDGNFIFVACQPVPQERLSMGYHDLNKSFPFVKTTYDGGITDDEIHELYIESDVVVTGSAPDYFLKERLDMGKLTFRYSERAYKTGLWKAFTPNDAVFMNKIHGPYRDKPLYMLCASGYTAYDMSIHHLFIGKTFKWGYFPQSCDTDIEGIMSRKSGEKIRLLWAGRLIPYKQPEMAIQIAKRLADSGIDFEMNIIGNGELEVALKKIASDNKLDSYVSFLGAMTPEKVREYMVKSDIFLFTSNYEEGWGAVLNEAMDSACACVVSHAVGSAPFLIDHCENGLIYRSKDLNDCFEKVKFLIDSPERRMAIGKNAFDTIHSQWTPEIAAENFVVLCKSLLEGKSKSPVLHGPASRAEVIKQKDMYKHLVKGKQL